MSLDIVIFGLSITSSWGNGHATTYRALTKALAGRGHRITFLERDVPWYRKNRDLRDAPYCDICLYRELTVLPRRFHRLVTNADLVILGSFVPRGAIVADWITSNAQGITAFYDIDTPWTLSHIDLGEIDYISAAIIPRFDLYLSFTGGPTLEKIEKTYGSPRARSLYCSADPAVHSAVKARANWELGYLGTYSEDRQEKLEQLLFEPARAMPASRFVVAGPQYPKQIEWPKNVERIDHLPPADHPAFYRRQLFTLSVTRADMVAAGYSPSVRLFEAAACGVPVITDRWTGLNSFFEPGEEILVADKPQDVLQILLHMSEERRGTIAEAARRRVLRSHTPEHRARELESYYYEARAGRHKPSRFEAAAARAARGWRADHSGRATSFSRAPEERKPKGPTSPARAGD